MVVRAAFLGILAAGFACAQPETKSIPTGVVIQELGGGRREIIATARASENAVTKGASSMMMSTSMKAARLMIENELRKPEFAGGTYQEGEGEFLNNGEYCRLRGTFTPGK